MVLVSVSDGSIRPPYPNWRPLADLGRHFFLGASPQMWWDERQGDERKKQGYPPRGNAVPTDTPHGLCDIQEGSN